MNFRAQNSAELKAIHHFLVRLVAEKRSTCMCPFFVFVHVAAVDAAAARPRSQNTTRLISQVIKSEERDEDKGQKHTFK